MQKFKFSTDPELLAKVTDIVAQLDRPENAIVLCAHDESKNPGIGSRCANLADADQDPQASDE